MEYSMESLDRQTLGSRQRKYKLFLGSTEQLYQQSWYQFLVEPTSLYFLLRTQSESERSLHGAQGVVSRAYCYDQNMIAPLRRRGVSGEKGENKILPRCGTTFIVITVYECCSLLHISYH